MEKKWSSALAPLLLLMCVSCSTSPTPPKDALPLTGDLGTATNPVRCNGPEGEREYLNRLFTPDGMPAEFYRGGSYGEGPHGNVLDRYKVSTGPTNTAVFMDMYHPGHIETNAVPGFTIMNLINGHMIGLPANKAAHARLAYNTINAVPFDDSDDKLVAQLSNLLAAGLDVNARDAGGNTPLLMAADHLHHAEKILRLFLDVGADVNTQNNDGDTALHMAMHISDPDLEAIRYLVEHSISVTATNKEGDTAFVRVAWLLDHEDDPVYKKDDRLIAARILRDAGADQWEDYMGGPIKVVNEVPTSIDPTVAKLMIPSERDAAFRTILSWQKYRSKPAYMEREFKPLRHVVECPQREGPPIFAVFPISTFEKRAAPVGHIILIDADGAIIPHFMNANLLDADSIFADINGDGVIDEVSTISFSKGAVLHVLPVTREQTPVLNIKLKRKGFRDTAWQWRVMKTEEQNVFAIELGPQDPTAKHINTRQGMVWSEEENTFTIVQAPLNPTKNIIPKARLEWSKEKNAYMGPKGGWLHPFKRLNSPVP